jgi:hypothetical protein
MIDFIFDQSLVQDLILLLASSLPGLYWMGYRGKLIYIYLSSVCKCSHIFKIYCLAEHYECVSRVLPTVWEFLAVLPSVYRRFCISLSSGAHTVGRSCVRCCRAVQRTVDYVIGDGLC